MSAPKSISLADYAKHRGVTPAAVSHAVRQGRLVESLVMEGGHPRVRDAALADEEWTRNTRGQAQAENEVEESGIPKIHVSRARLEAAKAGIATLELLERKGMLVSAEVAKSAVREKFSEVRTKLLGVPARIRRQMPHIAAEDIRAIDEVIREALEAIASGAVEVVPEPKEMPDDED